jgi:hypothetical protein
LTCPSAIAEAFLEDGRDEVVDKGMVVRQNGGHSLPEVPEKVGGQEVSDHLLPLFHPHPPG